MNKAGSERNSISGKSKANKSSQESLHILKEPLAILEEEIQKYQQALDLQQEPDPTNDKYKASLIKRNR